MQIEKRRFLNLRLAANEAPPHQKDAMVMMARMLEPDKLAKVDERLAEHYLDRSLIRVLVKRGMTHLEAQAVAKHSKLPTEMLPNIILRNPIGHYMLSMKTIHSLDAAGVRTVGDFVRRRREEHILAGASEQAVTEATAKLMERGIRTIDNPPAKA